MAELKAEQGAFLEAVTGERLHAVLSYVNLQGQTWQYALWRQMSHVVNHSTYHRGQLTTMLRQLERCRSQPTFWCSTMNSTLALLSATVSRRSSMEAEIMQPEVDTTKAQAFAGRVCTALALLFAFFEYEQCGWFRRFAHRECMSARRAASISLRVGISARMGDAISCSGLLVNAFAAAL